jgi:transposase
MMRHAMNSTEIIENLGNEIQSLKSELNTYQKRCDQYMQAYDALQHQVKELLRNRFGKKSERFIDDPEHPQHGLFEDNANLFALADAAGSEIEDIQVPAHSRKKKKSDKELPRRVVVISLSEEDMQCSCGSHKEVIRYETKELLHHQPAVYEMIEQRREVAACPKGCDGAIITAPAPLHVLPKAKVTEEFLAFLMISKLDDRQPLYHLEKQLNERHGVDVSRQTMARWLIELMTPMQPILNLFKDQVIDYDVASCDPTTMQVLNEPGRPAETKSYVYCIRGGAPDKSVIIYEYNDKLHKQFVKDWFEGFNGYLHVDGDDFFELIGKIANLVNCNSHARRKFEPIAQGAKGKGLAKEALRFYKELYKVEREAKDNKMMPDQRYELRQKKSKPLMDKFKVWLDEMYPTVLPKSPLGGAIYYCIERWAGLMRFLDDGRLEADNNLTEQEIKPLVIARKNFLFCASVDGARALCMQLSLIRTAKLHGLDPYHYCVILLKRLPHCKSLEDYERVLPWNIEMDYVRPD